MSVLQNMPAVAQSLKLAEDATRPQILQRLREISTTGGKLALPLAAGAIAYDAAMHPSEAADGTVSDPSMARGLVAGGTAAGLVGGANKLLSMLPAGASAMYGTVNAPQMASDLTDIPQDDLNDIRNKLARNLPSWMQVGAIKQAADMSQVPEPSPVRMQSGAHPDFPAASSRPVKMLGESDSAHSLPPEHQIPDPDATAATTRPAGASNAHTFYPISGPMPNAEALSLPESNPAHIPDEQPPQDFDSHLAALKQLFAQIDAENGSSPGAVQNAAQSYGVTQVPQQPSFYTPPQNALMQASR